MVRLRKVPVQISGDVPEGSGEDACRYLVKIPGEVSEGSRYLVKIPGEVSVVQTHLTLSYKIFSGACTRT